jgi:hypothetical protein
MSANRFLVTTALIAMTAAIHAQSPALTNADVSRLVAMRVSDQTVIAVIHEAKTTQFDLRPLAVDELGFHGVSPAVIAAMRVPTPVPIAAPAQSPNAGRQTIAEASEAAKNIQHDWSLSTNMGKAAPPPAPMTPEDREKFKAVYQASKALTSALNSGAIAAVTERVIAFDAALSIVADTTTTGASGALAEYRRASAACEKILSRWRDYIKTHNSYNLASLYLPDALESLAKADAMYVASER